MHEASLMKGLMARIFEIAQGEGSQNVTRVSVWLGALSHMSADHFREHYGQSADGTIAEGAELEIECCDDVRHKDAQHIVLKSVEVTT